MRKIITVSLLTLALNATAGWGGNNGPWGNSGWNNGPWGGSKTITALSEIIHTQCLHLIGSVKKWTTLWTSLIITITTTEMVGEMVHGVIMALGAIMARGIMLILAIRHGVIITARGITTLGKMDLGATMVTISQFQQQQILVQKNRSNKQIV